MGKVFLMLRQTQGIFVTRQSSFSSPGLEIGTSVRLCGDFLPFWSWKGSTQVHTKICLYQPNTVVRVEGISRGWEWHYIDQFSKDLELFLAEGEFSEAILL